jgi:hypothetical protein
MPPKYSESDVDRLQRSLDALNGRLAESKEDITKKKKQARAASTSVKQSMTRAARVIMCLPHGDLELAVSYLTQRAELQRKDKTAVQASLQNWFLSTDEAQRLRWSTHPPTTQGKAALREAEAFLEEWSLQNWVGKQNLEKGIAPLSGVVWSQREKRLNAAVAAGHLPTSRPAKQKHRLQWLRRWRLRWNIKLGTIQAREHVPAIDCQNKAEHPPSNHYFAYRSSKKNARRLNCGKKEGPESGPFFGSA